MLHKKRTDHNTAVLKFEIMLSCCGNNCSFLNKVQNVTALLQFAQHTAQQIRTLLLYPVTLHMSSFYAKVVLKIILYYSTINDAFEQFAFKEYQKVICIQAGKSLLKEKKLTC